MAEDVRGLRPAYAATSQTNAQAYQIKQALREVHTNFLGIVQSCESTEEKSGATFVSVLPAVSQTDGEDKALQMVTIPKCPHYRVQQGICALVIDPVPGDIGVFNALKADSTTVAEGTTQPQRPGSLREFSQSNSIMTGAVHTKTPENWITLRQDKTRESYAPEGIKDRTDKDNQQVIGQNLIIQVGKDLTLTIGANKTVTIQGNFTGTISGTANLTVQGAVSINAPAGVTITSPNTKITGNLTVGGNLACDGSGGGGNCTIKGNVSATGSVHSDADVTAGGISLNSHTHTCPDGQTSGPQ